MSINCFEKHKLQKKKCHHIKVFIIRATERGGGQLALGPKPTKGPKLRNSLNWARHNKCQASVRHKQGRSKVDNWGG